MALIKFEKLNSWEHWTSVCIASAHEEDPNAKFAVRIFGYKFECILPNWICQPYVTMEMSRLKNDVGEYLSYERMCQRIYGFSIWDDSLIIRYGAQDDLYCSTSNLMCLAFPWKDFRLQRSSLLNLDGSIFHTDIKDLSYDEQEQVKDMVPKQKFTFNDVDDEFISGECFLAEREWHLGRGFWKWLSLLSKPLVQRSCVITYSAEVGSGKTTYKGGVMQTSFPVERGMTIEDVLFLHAQKNRLTNLQLTKE